jgi:hypothetical protein
MTTNGESASAGCSSAECKLQRGSPRKFWRKLAPAQSGTCGKNMFHFLDCIVDYFISQPVHIFGHIHPPNEQLPPHQAVEFVPQMVSNAQWKRNETTQGDNPQQKNGL